jgi:hypothetical protein
MGGRMEWNDTLHSVAYGMGDVLPYSRESKLIKFCQRFLSDYPGSLVAHRDTYCNAALQPKYSNNCAMHDSHCYYQHVS